MKNVNLQMFAASNEAVKGNRIIYLFRLLKNATTVNAMNIAFTTENSRSVSRDVDTTITKDGAIRTPGEAEVEITATAILSKDQGAIVDLETAMYTNEIVEVWEANLDVTGPDAFPGTFAGRYFQGYITEFEQTSNAEDYVECSLTFAINGTGAEGFVTVSEDQLKIASYVFSDTKKTGA